MKKKIMLSITIIIITITACEIPANTPAPPPASARYVSPTGSDDGAGTEDAPWQTMKKAFRSIEAGDTLYMRGGVYETCFRCGYFENSGTEEQPITVTNYPGERVEIQVTDERGGIARAPFLCWAGVTTNPTPAADYIRVIGMDVNDKKGIVLRGMIGEEIKTPGVWLGGDCDHWEVAGLEIADMGKGVFLKKYSYQTIDDQSPDYFTLRDTLISNYYSGEGIKVGGNYGVYENNQVYKVTDIINTDWSCNHIGIIGHNNTIKGNDLNAKGSLAGCVGILFEWDIADYNIVENNLIDVVGWGNQGYVVIAGGDNNIIRHNVITGSTDEWYHIYGGTTYWPCNELQDAMSIVPANDPTAPDYEYFYNPRNCFSEGNQFYGNVYTIKE